MLVSEGLSRMELISSSVPGVANRSSQSEREKYSSLPQVGASVAPASCCKIEVVCRWYNFATSNNEPNILTSVCYDIQRSCDWEINQIQNRFALIESTDFSIKIIHIICGYILQLPPQSEAHLCQL